MNEIEQPLDAETPPPETRSAARQVLFWVEEVATLVLVVLLAYGIAALIIPFTQVNRAQAALRESDALLGMGRPSDAYNRLQRTDALAQFHAPSVGESIRLKVRCLVRLGHLEDAEALAQQMHELPAPGLDAATSPSGIRSLLNSMPDRFCLAILSYMAMEPYRWDNWAGYRTYLSELDREQSRALFTSAIDRIARAYPDNPFIVRRPTLASIGISDQPALRKRRASPRPAPPLAAATTTPETPPQPAAEPDTSPVSASAEPTPTPPPAESEAVPPPVDTQSPQWGVVRDSLTYAYNRKGERKMRLPVGTLVDIKAVTSDDKRQWAESSFDDEGIAVSGMLIHAEDLDIQSGNLAEANEKEKELLTRRARIRSEIGRMKGSGGGQTGETPALAIARDKYSEFMAEAQRLTTEMDQATGSRRMDIIDRLHRMKAEETQLRRELEMARTLASGKRGSYVSAANPLKIAELEKEISGIDEELKKLR